MATKIFDKDIIKLSVDPDLRKLADNVLDNVYQGKGSPLSVTKVAETFKVKKSRATRLINALIGSGYAERENETAVAIWSDLSFETVDQAYQRMLADEIKLAEKEAYKEYAQRIIDQDRENKVTAAKLLSSMNQGRLQAIADEKKRKQQKIDALIAKQEKEAAAIMQQNRQRESMIRFHRQEVARKKRNAKLFKTLKYRVAVAKQNKNDTEYRKITAANVAAYERLITFIQNNPSTVKLFTTYPNASDESVSEYCKTKVSYGYDIPCLITSKNIIKGSRSLLLFFDADQPSHIDDLILHVMDILGNKNNEEKYVEILNRSAKFLKKTGVIKKNGLWVSIPELAVCIAPKNDCKLLMSLEKRAKANHAYNVAKKSRKLGKEGLGKLCYATGVLTEEAAKIGVKASIVGTKIGIKVTTATARTSFSLLKKGGKMMKDYYDKLPDPKNPDTTVRSNVRIQTLVDNGNVVSNSYQSIRSVDKDGIWTTESIHKIDGHKDQKIKAEEPADDAEIIEEIDWNQTEMAKGVRAAGAVHIGYDLQNGKEVKWRPMDADTANKHGYLFGKSGEGKTYLQQCMMSRSPALTNNSIFYIDFKPSLMPDQMEQELLALNPIQHEIGYTPLEVNPFAAGKTRTGRDETPYQIATRVVGTFKSVYSSFGEQQGPTLMRCIEDNLLSDPDFSMDDLVEALREKTVDDNDKEVAVYDEGEKIANKIEPLCRANVFGRGNTGWETLFNDKQHQLQVLQLGGIDSKDMQKIIGEFLLWGFYAAAQRHGSKQRPLTLYVDECHNARYCDGSPLFKMLKEGREWVSVISATQQYNLFDKKEIGVMLQASQGYMFKPSDDEAVAMAKILDARKPAKKGYWLERLANLKKTQCISLGVDGISITQVSKIG